MGVTGFFEDAWDYLTTPNENLTKLVPGGSEVAAAIGELGIESIPGIFGEDPNAGRTNFGGTAMGGITTMPTSELDLWQGPDQMAASVPRNPRAPLLRQGGYAYKMMPATSRMPAGYRWVRTRRMNPLNPRALARAHSRAKSFEAFVLRNFSILHRSKVRPKRRRRK